VVDISFLSHRTTHSNKSCAYADYLFLGNEVAVQASVITCDAYTHRSLYTPFKALKCARMCCSGSGCTWVFTSKHSRMCQLLCSLNPSPQAPACTLTLGAPQQRSHIQLLSTAWCLLVRTQLILTANTCCVITLDRYCPLPLH
jgi:hypothetical protein